MRRLINNWVELTCGATAAKHLGMYPISPPSVRHPAHHGLGAASIFDALRDANVLP